MNDQYILTNIRYHKYDQKQYSDKVIGDSENSGCDTFRNWVCLFNCQLIEQRNSSTHEKTTKNCSFVQEF